MAVKITTKQAVLGDAYYEDIPNSWHCELTVAAGDYPYNEVQIKGELTLSELRAWIDELQNSLPYWAKERGGES